MTVSAGRRWYLAQTHVHAEAKAAAHLVRQGFTTYLPQYLKRRSHARRVESVAVPLFPRYLFVAFDIATERWRSVQSTLGIARLVAMGDAPIAVPENIIRELRLRENASGFVHLDLAPKFVPGDNIRVVGGAFDSCLGLYEGMADRDRVAVLLDLLGRKVRVVLEGDRVAAA